jgi:tetratricopeptide (TPR) repeat protein
MQMPPDDDVEFAGTADLRAAIAHGRNLLSHAPRGAAAQAREILAKSPHEGEALRLLAAALRKQGALAEARQAETAAIEASSHVRALVESAQALSAGRLNEAEHLLRPWLDQHPEDAAALRLLAEVAARVGKRHDAQDLLRKALEIAPAYRSARIRLSSLLLEEGKAAEALTVLDDMLAFEPDSVAVLASKASVLGKVGEYSRALELYKEMLALAPDKPGLWLSLGHINNTLGDAAGSIAAYRRVTELQPAAGVAWWSLANLKSYRFSDEDVAVMTAALADEDLSEDNALHLHFALGTALEARQQFEAAFSHYRSGNQTRRKQNGYDAPAMTDMVDRVAATFDRRLFESAAGHPTADPIFIVGMPRAGSTLVEQILASHSAIEGTSELPVLPMMVRNLEEEMEAPFPELVATLPRERLAALGKEYLESTRVYRKTDRRRFIDKLPNNWLHVGLITLMLPNATIIDARRHPLDCCFSVFKQNFARGQVFSYDLDDVGRYYRDYVRLMAHFDEVLPGHVHRLIHENLIADSEGEIRRLLAAVGVPFEEGTLDFHRNERAVRTPSAEQVRRPINTDGVARWKPFEPWLDPLKEALGNVLDCYPAVPGEWR